VTVSGQASPPGAVKHPPPATRRDARRNHDRVLAAAGEVLGESGADAGMEEIAARAGVGVGTVYRRFASKDALIDELLRLALEQILSATERALARTDGHGLEELLRALGQSFADHARYASLLLAHHTDDVTAHRIRAAVDELTARARAAGTVNPGITAGDVLVLVWAMRGLVQAAGQAAPEAWPRFLDIQLAGLRASGPVSSTPPLSARQLAELAPAGRARRSRAAGKPIVDLALG
jgi:AcrR family transcriptional regulator